MNTRYEERFSRLLGIRDYPADAVSEARVLVGGIGALGNELVKNLCLLGFRRFFLVDFDRVELSNLTRSVLFRARDVGRPKVEAAAEAAGRIYEEAEFAGHFGDIALLGLGVFSRMDLIFSDFDAIFPRLCINSAAARLGKVWIDAGLGLDPYQASVAIYDGGDGEAPCFVCRLGPRVALEELRAAEGHLGCQERDRQRIEDGFLPTTPTTSALAAALQAQAALECLLHGVDEANPWSAGGVRVNLRSLELSRWRTRRSRLCTYHAPEDKIDPATVLRFPDWESSHTTVAELFAGLRAAAGLAEDAVLHLKYPWLQAGIYHCPDCGRDQPVFLPVAAVERLKQHGEPLRCRHCDGADLEPDPLFGELGSIPERGFPFPQATLREVGVRPLDILEFLVEEGDELRLIRAEVSGDEAAVFRPLVAGVGA
jgi:adenylyltransferase/sulfurtransferase